MLVATAPGPTAATPPYRLGGVVAYFLVEDAPEFVLILYHATI
jgi:hypothetical protein